jgi:hypothetical protein
MLYYTEKSDPRGKHTLKPVAPSDPFHSSMLARSALSRLAISGAVIAGLWLAVLWAVVLP